MTDSKLALAYPMEDNTVRDLRNFAKQEGINLHGSDVKGQIIDAIRTQYGDQSGAMPETEPKPDPLVGPLLATFAMGGLEAVLRSPAHIRLPDCDHILGFSDAEFRMIRKRASMGYHLSDGIFFLRLDDGSVRVQKSRTVAGYGDDGSTPFSFDLQAETWATILEEMSSKENSLELHQAARDLHA